MFEPVASTGANVAQSIFDLAGTGAQLAAMLTGAFLASAGGFFVAWLLDRMQRKRQERSIALVCMDLLTTLAVITNLAKDSRTRGDPYGPLTMRFLRRCHRDLDVYERNRERIADIDDAPLRSEIYQCMARYVLTVDGILSETDIIAKLDDALSDARKDGDNIKLEHLAHRRQTHEVRRDASFDFLMETVASSDPVSSKLRRLAKAPAVPLSDIVARNLPTQPAPPPGGG